MSEDNKKDVAIFYPRNLDTFVEELEIALEKKGVSTYPTYQDDDIGLEKNLRDAVKGSEFRVFLVNSQFLKEDFSSHFEILQSCKECDTLIILDKSLTKSARRADFKHFRTEKMKSWTVSNATTVAEFVYEFMVLNADKSNNADTSGQSGLDSNTESTDSIFDKSTTTSPVLSESRKRRTNTSPQPWSSRNKSIEEIKEDLTSDSTLEPQRQSDFKLAMILAFVFSLFALGMLISQNAVEDREVTTSEKFLNQIEALQSQFEQDPKFWRTVRSTMKKHIIDDDPRQPAVLMLVSTKSAAELREKLAREIAEAYSNRCNNREPVWVSGDDYVAQGHATVKEKLDDKISSGFSSSSCATVVSNFERLPPASTTVFYQFCENDQAPFKKVAVILTLEISHGSWDSDGQLKILQDGEAPKSTLWDQIVENFLYHSLETRDRTEIMKKDMIGGLLSRITPAVAWVNNGDQ